MNTMNTMNTIELAFSYDVITQGVLPDLEDPRDRIEVETAPIAQAPSVDDDEWDARQGYGFVRRGRRFRTSLLPTNLEMAARMYAPSFGMAATRTERFVLLLQGVVRALGEEATPDEVFVAMRQLLIDDPIEPTKARLMRDAWLRLWSYQDTGSAIFDPQA
jgi:hypothetical protein